MRFFGFHLNGHNMTRVVRQALILLMVLSLFLPVGLVPLTNQSQLTAQAAGQPELEIGDYVKFGNYNNAAILWRVINIDPSTGYAVLFAENILTVKGFDGSGNYHTSEWRKPWGSNYYPDSNIRQWLNSDSPNTGSDRIDWIQNDPSAMNMYSFSGSGGWGGGSNPYNNEKGFLADGNFSSIERNLIVPLTHKVLLDPTDAAKKDGGTEPHGFSGYSTSDMNSAVANYDTTAYYKNVTDNVFLLSVKQLKEWVSDRGYQLRAKPTPQAVAQSSSYFPLNTTFNFRYYLNTYSLNRADSDVRCVDSLGEISRIGANIAHVGIRPAVQLNAPFSLLAPGGDGTSNNPYEVVGFGSPEPDLEAPTAPSLSASGIFRTKLTLNWTAATDNVGVYAYEIYQNATLLGTLTRSPGKPLATTYQVGGLLPGTNYTFTVKAKDYAGNLSSASNAAVVTTATGSSSIDLKLGDYVQFGYYNNAPIIWRVIRLDAEDNPVLFADRILTIKPFDTTGSFYPNFNEDSSWNERFNTASNYYQHSNIRQWLNSSSQNKNSDIIDWIQNDPDEINSYNGNAYATEKGFLADDNFTAAERAAILPLTHKVLLHSVDESYKDGGSASHIDNDSIAQVVQNYDTNALYQNVTDKVFLLSVKQLKEWVYDNRTILGNNYRIGYPTAEAVAQNTIKYLPYTPSTALNYWLNTPGDASSPSLTRYVYEDGRILSSYVNTTTFGIRPAVQLNAKALEFDPAGDGAINAPYIVKVGVTDAEAPTAPTNLDLVSVKKTGAKFSWSASTDNVDVTEYRIYRGLTHVATVRRNGDNPPATSGEVSGLSAATNYSFTVRAVDRAGNLSPASNALEVTTAVDVKVGDYIQFGKYNNVPILWRVIHLDSETEHPVLLADRILTFKAFDAKGSYHTSNFFRQYYYGSNFYPDSNIRQWLNSSQSEIDWIQNDPSADNVENGVNPYDTEKGFLVEENFTFDEMKMIKPLTQKVVIDETDQALKDGGSVIHYNSPLIESVDTNHDSGAYYKDVTDKVFLLSTKQLKEWLYNNRSILGVNYYLAKPTPQAVTQNTTSIPGISSSNDAAYWLNSADADWPTYPSRVRTVDTDGFVQSKEANMSTVGVRPAMQMNISTLYLTSGNGKSNNPYVAEPKPIYQAPTDISLSAASVAENLASGTTVGTLSTVDADVNDVFTYSLVSGAGDTNNASFTIDGTALKTATIFDYETKSSYSIRVRVKDKGDLTFEKQISINVTDVDDIAPTMPTNFVAGSVSGSSLTLSWTASTDNVGVTGYEVYRGTTLLTTTASTSYNVTGLSQGTTYSFQVRAVDAAGNKSMNVSLSARTKDLIAPSAPSALTVRERLDNSIRVTWTASTDNVGVLGYNVFLNHNYVGSIVGPSYTFTGLNPGTNYIVTVSAYDADRNESTRAPWLSTSTLTPLDRTAPSVPTNLQVLYTEKSKIGVRWTASTDASGIAGYNVFLNGAYHSTVTAPAVEFTGLSHTTSYSIQVQAVDNAKNSSTRSTSLSASTLDGTAPTVPTGLASSAISRSGFTVTWTASTDNVAVRGYEIYRNGTLVTTVGASITSYTFTGLSESSSHAIRVLAFDALSNRSSQSTALIVTTAAGRDTIAPSAPGNVKATNVFKRNFRVNWTPATDNVGIKSYDIFVNGSYRGTVASVMNFFLVTDLAQGTKYNVRVNANDFDNNSTPSTILSVTTLP